MGVKPSDHYEKLRFLLDPKLRHRGDPECKEYSLKELWRSTEEGSQARQMVEKALKETGADQILPTPPLD